MATIRAVERAPRTVSTDPVLNEYTDLVVELQRIEDERRKSLASLGEDEEKPRRQEAVIEQSELPDGTEPKDVRKEINATARTHGIALNFKTAKDEWPIIFAVSVPRDADEDEEEAPKAAGKAA